MATSIYQLDAAYRPFPPFDEWAAIPVNGTRWDRYLKSLENVSAASPDQLQRARTVAMRAAAIDTGAIEDLYDVDRGFTFTIATQGAAWQAVLNEKGETARALIEAQLKAYDYVLDLATQASPISEKSIRELHIQLCAGQETYMAYTEVGPQEQKLPLGKYKSLPNHVRTPDGSIHAYAPVDAVPEEMHRLCEELQSKEFLAAHPVLQAAYAHYAFVAVHPFADGNGRVARALASVFSYRANSIPFLVLAQDRTEYFLALRNADQGEYLPFVDFALERALDAVQLVEESLRAASAPAATDLLGSLKRLYVTKGGYTHAQVDQAAASLLQLVHDELAQRVKEYMVENQFCIAVVMHRHSQTLPIPDTRLPVDPAQANSLLLNFTSAAPARASVQRQFVLQVPADSGVDDDLVIADNTTQEVVLAVRIADVIPVPRTVLQMRIALFGERVASEGLAILYEQAATSLRNSGYVGRP